MIIRAKKLTQTAKLPTQGSKFSTGYDLYADTNEPITIPPGGTVYISTGLAIELPADHFGAVYPRSGLSLSLRGLRPANCVGVIDSDYRGAINVALHNDSPVKQKILPHERVAQLICQRYTSLEFLEVDELTETERGESGFGSTEIEEAIEIMEKRKAILESVYKSRDAYALGLLIEIAKEKQKEDE